MDESFYERAQELAMMEVANGIAVAASKPRLQPCGICHNCQTSIDQGREFCDAECREEYDYVQNIRRKQGLLK